MAARHLLKKKQRSRRVVLFSYRGKALIRKEAHIEKPSQKESLSHSNKMSMRAITLFHDAIAQRDAAAHVVHAAGAPSSEAEPELREVHNMADKKRELKFMLL